MNKNQKLAIGILSGFLVVILVVLSLVSSAGPAPEANPVASNSSTEICQAQNDFYEYNPDTNEWNDKAPLPEEFGGKRISAVAFSIGARGYIATGEYELNNITIYTRDLWMWDENTGTGAWTQMAPLPLSAPARSGATGFSIGRRGYVGTGGNEYGVYKDFYEYNGDEDDENTVTGYNTWTRKADFGGAARTAAVGFPIAGTNNKGYIGTGVSPQGLHQDFYEWDQLTDKWTPMEKPFPGGARSHAVGFSLYGKGYVGTGKAIDGYKNDFYELDPVTGEWLNKDNVPGDPRTSAVGFSTESKGYVGIGASLNGRVKDFHKYDPSTGKWSGILDYEGGATDYAIGFSIRDTGYVGTGFSCEEEPPVACTPDSWNQKADFGGVGRWQAEGVSISTNGKGYIGMGTSSTITALKDFYEWDPNLGVNGSGAWNQRASLPPEGPSRVDPVAFSIEDKAYMGTGGDGNSAYYKDFWEFNPAGGTNGSGSWTQKAVFPGTGRRSASGFAIGTKGYIGTGVNDNLNTANHFKDFYEWDKQTNRWTAKANFPGPARSTAVGFSIGTKGYMGTGADYGNSYSDFYEYDPTAGPNGTWKKKTDFQGPTRGQAAGFSLVGLDGNTYGYIGTGAKNNYVQTGSALKDFWRFNPTGSTTGWPAGSGLWEPKKEFGGTARINAAAFSLNGKGYMGTGLDNTNGTLNYTTDFWEYCPD